MSAPVYVLLGGTGGIGAPLARRLASDGATVVLGARDADRLGALADETGGKAFTLDATSADAVSGLVDAAVSEFGRIDGAINLVGSILLKPAHATSPEEFDETLTLNLKTAFYLVRATMPPVVGSVPVHFLRVPQCGNHPLLALSGKCFALLSLLQRCI